jgi:uncharacterized protein YcfJ
MMRQPLRIDTGSRANGGRSRNAAGGRARTKGVVYARRDAPITAGLTVLGAGAGALVGYAIGRGRRKRVLVYEAARP